MSARSTTLHTADGQVIHLLTKPEAAAFLGISVVALDRRLERDTQGTSRRPLPRRYVGRCIRFHPVELDAWTRQAPALQAVRRIA